MRSCSLAQLTRGRMASIPAPRQATPHPRCASLLHVSHISEGIFTASVNPQPKGTGQGICNCCTTQMATPSLVCFLLSTASTRRSNSLRIEGVKGKHSSGCTEVLPDTSCLDSTYEAPSTERTIPLHQALQPPTLACPSLSAIAAVPARQRTAPPCWWRARAWVHLCAHAT